MIESDFTYLFYSTRGMYKLRENFEKKYVGLKIYKNINYRYIFFFFFWKIRIFCANIIYIF